MRVDLLRYMSNRLQEECVSGGHPGPVITISRLYGCPAKKVAKRLTEELTEKMLVKGYKKIQWKMITKEIMSESARELDLDPSKIQYVFDYEQKGIIDDILSAHLSKYYKSDRRIRKTVAKVIRNIACEGHAVIVGRGGVALTRDIPDSLHINLDAPMEWRVLRVSEKHELSLEEAERYAKDIDKKRRQFREYFEGKNTDYTQFDLTFNCMTLSIEEIVKIILKAAEVRKLI
ncbi:MAG: cytidylate kinase-like family protein [Bacteroidales bacterium]|jgi:cytidylate kinase